MTLTLEYIAGFFDGEGSCGVSKKRNPEGRINVPKPFISITNTDLSVIKEIQSIIGFGKIYEHKEYHKIHRTMFHLEITKPHEIIKFADLLLNRISIKKSILSAVKEYAVYLNDTRLKHKTWAGKSSSWKNDLPYAEKHFIIPIMKLSKRRLKY